MLEFIFKQTKELSAEEKTQICRLFLEVYGKEKSIDRFEQEFGRTVFNYSYHSLMVDGDKIVGHFSALPLEYNYFGQRQVFALSVDTMIAKNYRGRLSNLKKMANLIYEALIREGIPFIYGFPNENFYLVKKKVLGWGDIGELDYYVLPVRIGALKSKLRIFNLFTLAFAAVITQISRVVMVKAGRDGAPIEKVNDANFLAYRYDKSYRIIKGGNGAFFVYKIDCEAGARVAYLMDVCPMNAWRIVQAVNVIFQQEKQNLDVIAYLGKLPSRPMNLFKVPKWLEPQAVKMSGKILASALIDNRVYNLDNWNVNLSNFDVR